MMMADRILKSVNAIPAFPPTSSKVAQLMRETGYSLNQVANIIKLDPSMTANILKMANSAYFGAMYKISNINDAVIYLGQENLLRAISTAGVSRYYQKGAAGYFDKASDLWEHSVAVALMTQILSRMIYGREDNTLYTSALLHDVGKIIMGQFVRASLAKISNLVTEQGKSFPEAEEEVLGIDHAELGGIIAVHWNFPLEISEAIAFHHRPDLLEKQDKTMPWIVYAADQACLMLGLGDGVDGLAHRAVSQVLKKLNMKMKDLEMSMVLLSDDLRQAKELINII